MAGGWTYKSGKASRTKPKTQEPLGGGIPQDLTTLSPKVLGNHAKVIAKTTPLKTLRRNQDLIDQQITMADKNTNFSATQKDKIIQNLQIRRQVYDAAVNYRVFELGKKD
jgi:hypothetical protein